MRFWCVAVLNCLVAAAVWGTEITVAVRVEVADKLEQAMELERHGRFKEAERVLVAALRAAERADNASMELAVILNNLGVHYTRMGRFGDAEQRLKRAIRTLEALPGVEAGQMLARAKVHLAVVYLDTNRIREAERLNLLRLLATLRSPEDQVQAKCMIAALATSRGELDEAERLYLDALSFWREPARAPQSASIIATILNNLGVLAVWQGRTEVGRERLEESLALWRELAVPPDPSMVKSMANIATAYRGAKRYDDALLWLERALEAGRTTFGELHPLTVQLQQSYADTLKKAGRQTAAREAARTAAEARAMMRSSTSAYTVDYRDLAGRP